MPEEAREPQIFTETMLAPTAPLFQESLQSTEIDPIQQRIRALEEINPQTIARINRPLVEQLMILNLIQPEVSRAPFSQKGARERIQTIAAQNQLQFCLDLSLILKNPDLVDILVANLGKKEPEQLVEAAMKWKKFNINRLRSTQLLPEEVRNEKQYFDYMIATSLIRPGKEKTLVDKVLPLEIEQRERTGTGGLAYQMPGARAELTYLSPAAHNAILHAGFILFDYNLIPKEAAEALVLETLHHQEKWSVFGGDLELDPTSKELLRFLGRYGSEKAIPGITQSLFRRVALDKKMIPYIYQAPERPLAQGFLVSQIEAYLYTNLGLDQEATQTALAPYLLETDWAHQIVTDLMVAAPSMHAYKIPVSPSKEFTYYGQKHSLERGESLQEISIGLLAVRDKDGEVIGALDISLITPGKKANFIPLAKLGLPHADKQAAPEQIQEFLEDYSLFTSKVIASMEKAINPAALPLAATFELWKYLKANPRLENQVFTFLSEYRLPGLASFLVSKHGHENIPLLLDFGLEAQELRSWEKDQITYIRTRDSFTEHVFKEYTFLTQFSQEIAFNITADPVRAHEIQNRILLRAKAMLVAAAKIHQKKGGLTQEEQAYIGLSFDFYNAYLRGLTNPESDESLQLGIPFELLQKFFRYHDLSDPDIASLYKSAEDHWFDFWARRQKKHAPYSGKVDEINHAFYAEYADIEKDSARQTGDPEMETKRGISIYDHLEAAGLFPENASVRTDCCGSGHRVDEKLIQHLKENDFPVQLPIVGIEFLAHPSPPEGLEIIEGNLLKELRKSKHQDQYDIVWRIWPGYPTDAMLLDLFKKDLKLNSSTIKPGGFYVVDIPFPYGEHSYAQTIAESDRAFLQEALQTDSSVYEPSGQMLHRQFEREGKPSVGKGFLIINPEILISKAKEEGLSIVNLPPKGKEREQLYQKIEHDDSILADRPDVFKHPIWQTSKGYNRITLVFYKGEFSAEMKAKLPQASYENEKA